MLLDDMQSVSSKAICYIKIFWKDNQSALSIANDTNRALSPQRSIKNKASMNISAQEFCGCML